MQATLTDTPPTFESRDMPELVDFSMARSSLQQIYETAGACPQDIQEVELNDGFA